MDMISDYDNLTIEEAYDILKKFKLVCDIGYEPLVPTYMYYPNRKTSYEKFRACMYKIKWKGFPSVNSSFPKLSMFD